MNQNMNELENILLVEGVNARGFGTIPKIVMQDKRLKVTAKAIYAYFCSYAGAGSTAFPSVAKIMSDLDLSNKTYYKHFNTLVECGYITVKQRIVNGKFSTNLFTLNTNPIAKNEAKNTVVENLHHDKKNEEIKNFSVVENLPCGKNSMWKNYKTNKINNNKINSINKINNNNNNDAKKYVDIFKVYEEVTNKPTSNYTRKHLIELIDIHGEEKVLHSITRNDGKTISINYIKKLLNSWINCTSIEEIETQISEYNKPKTKKKKETILMPDVPTVDPNYYYDWMNEDLGDIINTSEVEELSDIEKERRYNEQLYQFMLEHGMIE